MPDQSGTFPITAPLLERHYEDVQSFQEKRARSARLLSAGSIIALGISMLGNVSLAWAVASMLR